MILAGHQPNYLPNLAYFAKMQQADVFVVSSNLQFVRDKEWHRRNRVPGAHGDVWLTVPVEGGAFQVFRDVRIQNSLPWQQRHWRTLQALYAHSAGAEVLPLLEPIYTRRWERLVDLNFALITLVAEVLDIKTQLVLDEETTGRKQSVLVNVCRKYGADTYLSGAGGRLYMDETYWEALQANGIQSAFVESDFSRVYPYCALHYLLAYGVEWTKRVVRSSARLSGYQPQYFPRLHYFARMLNSDIFTVSDNVQFVKNHLYPGEDGGQWRGKSYQADTPIKQSDGLHYLTVPIKHEGRGLKSMRETKVAYDRDWVENHLRTLAVSYARAKNFRQVFPQLQALLGTSYANIVDLNLATLLWGLSWILGYRDQALEVTDVSAGNRLLARPHPFRLRHLVLKSAVDIFSSQQAMDATDAILQRCKNMGIAEYYVGGTAHQAYIDDERFRQAGVRLVEQDWVGKRYEQQFPKVGFVPNLSILDLVFNEDVDQMQRILQGEHVHEEARV